MSLTTYLETLEFAWPSMTFVAQILMTDKKDESYYSDLSISDLKACCDFKVWFDLANLVFQPFERSTSGLLQQNHNISYNINQEELFQAETCYFLSRGNCSSRVKCR
jgi:hypothetical protein